MNKIACQYAIVRFAPYVETGEFANVGIVMIAPKQNNFIFKLETRRYARITRFFEEMDSRLYIESMKAINLELSRIQGMLKNHTFANNGNQNIEFGQQLFNEAVRERESIVRFSEPRVTLATDPKLKLDELFAYYVERNFVTKEYRETVLERGVQKLLRQANIANRFQRTAVGDDTYHRTFPFVEQLDKGPVKIIKPLNLGHEEPSKIIDHGGSWLFALDVLKNNDKLPKKALFTVEGPPSSANEQRHSAFEHVVNRLKETGVGVVTHDEQDQIIDFASA